jgi:hypothetical protein
MQPTDSLALAQWNQDSRGDRITSRFRADDGHTLTFLTANHRTFPLISAFHDNLRTKGMVIAFP